MTPARFQESEQFKTIVEVLYTLRKRSYFILWILSITVVVTMIGTYRKVPLYQAKATMLVETTESRKNMLNSLAKMGHSASMETELQLLKSRTLSEDVARELRLELVSATIPYAQIKSIITSWEIPRESNTEWFRFEKDKIIRESTQQVASLGALPSVVSMGPYSFRFTEDPAPYKTFRFAVTGIVNVASNLSANTNIAVIGGESNVIEITSTSESPYLAKQLANIRIKKYIESNVHRRTKDLAQTETFLAAQLESAKKDLGSKGESLSSFREKHKGTEPEFELKKLMATNQELEKKISEIHARILRLQRSRELLKQSQKTEEVLASLVGSDSAVLDGLADDLRVAESRLSELSRTLTVQHPSFKEAQAKRDVLLVQSQDLMLSQLRSLHSEELAYQSQLNENNAKLSKLPREEMQYLFLKRAAAANESVYSYLSTGYEETKIARAATVPSISPIDLAVTPMGPFYPRPLQNFLTAFAAGLLLGVFLALLIEYIKNTVENLEEIERIVGKPIFTIIPKIINPRQLIARVSANAAFAPISNSSLNILELDAKDRSIDAFRTLRTNLFLSSKEQATQVLLMTSSIPNEGKSTITANFAFVLSDLGKKVIVIDADFRNPSLQGVYGKSPKKGLSDLILNPTSTHWEDHIVEVRNKTEESDVLHFLPSGKYISDPSQLLHSETFLKLVTELRAHYDYVLFDSPPVAVIPDAVLLSRVVDGVLLVVAPEFTTRSSLFYTCKKLREVDAYLLGAVINGRDQSAVNSGYGYGYGGYGYGYGDKESNEKLWDKVSKRWMKKIQASQIVKATQQRWKNIDRKAG